MFEKFFRHRKYKKIIRDSSALVLADFAGIVSDVGNQIEDSQNMKFSKKSAFEFESTAFLFWLLVRSGVFPETWHKLILDGVHDQYYDGLKKHGFDSRMRQTIADDLNKRYQAYDSASEDKQDFSKVGTKFAGFLSERSGTELNAQEIMIPGYLIKKVTPKFEEYRKAMI